MGVRPCRRVRHGLRDAERQPAVMSCRSYRRPGPRPSARGVLSLARLRSELSFAAGDGCGDVAQLDVHPLRRLAEDAERLVTGDVALGPDDPDRLADDLPGLDR